jgi:3',5'-nucleoside bisphosphate phosphatase
MLTAVLFRTPDNELLAPGRLLGRPDLRRLLELAVTARSGNPPHWLLDETSQAYWPASAAAVPFTAAEATGSTGEATAAWATVDILQPSDERLPAYCDDREPYYVLAAAYTLEQLAPQVDQLLILSASEPAARAGAEQTTIWSDPALAGFRQAEPQITGQVLWQRPSAATWLASLVQAGDCDLHLHTHCSDGADSPEQMVDRVLAAGLAAFAICDHDSIDGLEPARIHLQQECARRALVPPVFVPGVEISVEDGGERHLLGYFPRGCTPAVELFLAEQRQQRQQRNTMLIERLQELGYAIRLEDFLATGNGTIGRLQVALLLRDQGYFASIREAFDQLLDFGRPGYVGRQRPAIAEAIRLIRSSGGVAVLAHPAHYGWCGDQYMVAEKLLDQLERLRQLGLQGVEAYHGEASLANQAEIAAAGRFAGLVRTAGSDDHGRNKDRELLYRRGCRFINPSEILVSAALVAGPPQGGQPTWLLARRSIPGAGLGSWELPGGKVEPGEDAKAALFREIEEELGLRARIGRRLLVETYDYPERRVILAVFEAWLPGSPWQLTVHDDMRFVTAKEAGQLKLLPADIRIMEWLATVSE